jgi:hypothetical protein
MRWFGYWEKEERGIIATLSSIEIARPRGECVNITTFSVFHSELEEIRGYAPSV